MLLQRHAMPSKSVKELRGGNMLQGGHMQHNFYKDVNCIVVSVFIKDIFKQPHHSNTLVKFLKG